MHQLVRDHFETLGEQAAHHALVLDGVFASDGSGGVSFQAHDREHDDVGPLLATIQRRIDALLHRRGVSDGREGFDAPDRWAEDAPTLAGLAVASVHGVAALGARAGARVRRWGDTVEMPAPPVLSRWHARHQGFDLHAGIVVPAGHRDRLERLCRYALPPQRAGKRAPGAPGCGRRWGRTGCN